MTDTLLSDALVQAPVTAVEADGSIVVDGPAGALHCVRLQTTEAPPVALAVGDTVLVAAMPGGATGVVFGRIAGAESPPVAAADATGRHVEIVMPDGVETVRVAGRRIRIAADEELILECGGASIRIDGRGKVVVLGSDITSRARRLHKIKGASVAIN
jgi:hypothetical protein